MGGMSFVDNTIEKKLLDLHCGYIGKVLSTNGVTAKVQPLGKIKAADGTTKTQAPVSDVPVACRYKLTVSTISYTDASGNPRSQTVCVPRQIKAGDLVACLCADRDITEARKGKNEVPPAGHHSISDSIIVGILE